MGANANPIQKMVMDTLYTTRLRFHSFLSSVDGGLTSPAEYPAKAVTAQAIHVIIDLRHFGHRNGDVYFLRSGHSGGGDCPGPGGDVIKGVGSGVSSSK